VNPPGRALRWLPSALALGAGSLLPLALSPWELWPLAVLGLAVLFALWLPAGPRAAAWQGWLFGVGLFGVGASWVRESFQFSDVPAAAAVVLTGLFVVYLATFPAAAGYLAARLGRGLSVAWRAAVVAPSAWVASEWLRGWLFTGFPWLQVGYSQVDGPLAGLAPILGVHGVSWGVAAGAGLLVVLVRGPASARVGAAGLLGLIGLAGTAAGSLAWTAPTGSARTVAVVQGNVAQGLKWRDEERARTLDVYLGLTRAHWDADLVVWPETAVPMFAHRATELLAALADEAVSHGAEMLVGIPYAERAVDRYFNSVLAVGGQPGLYHKRHLVPFGEFVPLKGLLGGLLDLLNAPMSDFTPGPPGQPPLVVAGVRVGVSICYEDAFGAEVRRALPAAEVLVNVSNDAWFGDSIAPHQHQQMARMRALETSRDLVRATNTGISAFIDWKGQVVTRAPQFQAHVLRGQVVPRRGSTPYVRLGDLPVTLALLAVLLAAALVRRRPA
jgi:apolipoprotein N-acyltransferase